MTISTTTKIEAVQAVLNGATITQASQEHSISHTSLRKFLEDPEIMFEACRQLSIRKRAFSKRTTRTTPLVAIIYDLLQYTPPSKSSRSSKPSKSKRGAKSSTSKANTVSVRASSLPYSRVNDEKQTLSTTEIYEILVEHQFFGHQPISRRTVRRIILDIKEQLTDPKLINPKLDILIQQHQFKLSEPL